MSVSLKTLGQNEFSRSGNVSLLDLATSGSGYTREFTATGYDRFNPFQVANGNAPSPDTTPVNLSEFENYDQSVLNAGSDFDLDGITNNASNVTANFSWVRPSGYTNELSVVQQFFYYKDCISSSDCLTADPFDGGTVSDAGDSTSDGLNLSYDTYYVVGIQAQWDSDGDSTYDFPLTDGTYHYTLASTLSNGAENGFDNGIYFYTGTTTTTTTTTTATCFCQNDPCPSFSPAGTCSSGCSNAGDPCVCDNCVD